MNLTQRLRSHALSSGVSLIGFTDCGLVKSKPWKYDDDPSHYSPCRETAVAPQVYDPLLVMPQAKSIVMTGMYMYGYDHITPSTGECPRGNIGPWTRGYVEAGRYATELVEGFLQAAGYQTLFTNALPYISLAVQCGLGKVGNNGFLYHEGMGSYIRLGCVMTDAPLETVNHGAVSDNDCGNCKVCQRVCPTAARGENGAFDADRCLHLWLQGDGLYHDGIPREARSMCMNYLMRTGRCLSECPRNKRLVPRTDFPFATEDKDDSPMLIPLVLADDDAYRAALPYHVVKYGLEHIRRNVLIALGNSRSRAAVPVLAEGMRTLKPEYAALCAWALGEIDSKEAQEALLEVQAACRDPLIREEIQAALKTGVICE